jgi:hypothetical protein
VPQAVAHLEEAEALRRVPPSDPPIHPCPVCRGLAEWSPDHPRTVCRDCAATARCGHGRLVEGRPSNGAARHLVVLHRDDESRCETADGPGPDRAEVAVAAWPAELVATLTGVVVQASPRPVNAGDDLAMLAAAREMAELLAEVSGLPAPPLPAWTAGPFPDGDADEHLWRLAEHLVEEAATAWCDEHPGDDLGEVRHALAHLMDPALA